MNDEMELEPGVDLDAVNTENMDRGDNLEPTEEVAATEEPQSEVQESQPEEPAERERTRDEKGRYTSPKIPKARFDEAVGKERAAKEAAEKRAAELEAKLAEKEKSEQAIADEEAFEAKIDELQAKHADLLLEGETTQANKIMREIRQLERQRIAQEVEARSVANIRNSMEAERLNGVIARLEADYTFFNPESETYDQDMVDLTLMKQKNLIQQGMSPSQAMLEAAKQVTGRFAPQEAQKGLSKKEGDRRAAQIEKNLDTKRRQPPNMRDTGLDSDKLGASQNIDVTKLTQEEFNALPEATIKKLRGDLL